MASPCATFQPAMAISMQSWQGSEVLPLQSTQMRSQKKCGPRPILAQVQQEKPLSSRLQHLERCMQADGAAQLAASSVLSAHQCKEGAELIRVVYQGNVGGYSHALVEEMYGAGAEAVPCREMEGVFKAVETWVADAAFIPIQNNLDGSIHRNYDLLLRHRLHIVGEVSWHVNHCLLAHPSASFSDLRHVIGHPQALAHCCETLADLGLQAEEEEDITNAAFNLSASSPLWANTALVASSQAASVFGLQIIHSGIQDDSQNITRFLQLAREPSPAPSPLIPCKTTIAFALGNGPSDLCKVMSAFALRDIKVTNLESRPASQMQRQEKEMALAPGRFRYMFFVDIEASSASVHTQRALRQVEELSSFYRVLGSYPLVPNCQRAILPSPQTCIHSSV